MGGFSKLQKTLGFLGKLQATPDFWREAERQKDLAAIPMTVEELIAEGRLLQRPCNFLRPMANGEVAAVWHAFDNQRVDESGHRPWVSIDTRFIPGFDTSLARFVTICVDEVECNSGRVEIVSCLPDGLPLYAYVASVLPPIDAVFACGSDRIGKWLEANGWARDWRYNDNFRVRAVVKEYERQQDDEHPLYSQETDVYAVLGGWHVPIADDDWHSLIPGRLLAMTLLGSEPWVEAWLSPEGEYRVIQRVT